MLRCLLAVACLLLGLLPLGTLSPGPLPLYAQSTADTRQSLPVDPALFQGLEARTVGPSRGGRVTTVAGHPAHPHTFYMGATGGGVWKTTDHGATWTNISDGHGFRSASMGALAIAPSDTSVIYAGTGSDAIRSNVITGRGIYRSTDAGRSWADRGLANTGQIGAIEVHPNDPDRAYVAALGSPFGRNPERGVFRTTDGGASWEKVLYASDSTGAIDLELHPETPDVIYAALWRGERKPWTIISGAREENGLYRSTDGGDTWTKLEDGLPQGLIGKADFAVTPAAPDRVYALVEAPGDRQGLYRSDDRGDSWTQMSDTTGIMNRPFYFTNLTAHPQNADVVYAGNVRDWVSTDGGATFERKPATHADVHARWINPENPDLRVQGNDGGATVTLDGGRTWSTQHNQNTAELYQVYVDDRFPYWLYAGQQDNTTVAVPSQPPAESAPAGPEGWWHAVGGCETGPVVPRPGAPSTLYANCKGRFGRYSRTTGQEQNFYVGGQYLYGRNPGDLQYRFQRVAPIEVSPHDSTTVLHGSQFVHKTTDGGVTWTTISPDLTANDPQYQVVSGGPITRDITGEEHFSTLYTIRISPHNADVIWTGANDGPVHVTRDGGTSWTDITPPGLPKNARIDAIDPSPHAPGTAYVAAHRRLVDDFAPYVYRTTDFGQTWTRLTDGANGIPDDFPVRVVREDPDRQGLLYAGTDFGLFVSFDDGARWQPLSNGLPVTPITDIRVHRQDLVLSTMGRGFWIVDNLTPLHQVADVSANAPHLFAPRDAVRHRVNVSFWSQNAHDPEFPEPGAMVDFVVPDASEAVALAFLADDGSVLRRFSTRAAEGGATARKAAAPTAVMDVPADEVASAPLEVVPGHNRFTWDLRHAGPQPGPVGEQAYYGPGHGPMVAPGTYRVRLTVGATSRTETLRVRIDPRVEADGTTPDALRAQEQFGLALRDAIADARATVLQIDTLAAHTEDDATYDRLADLRSTLVTRPDGSYPKPVLIDQMEYLYFMVTRADQPIGADAKSRLRTLRERLTSIRAEVRTVAEATGVTLGAR
jgi:photosystem II stability/assembly factor-like uncharacterized protein